MNIHEARDTVADPQSVFDGGEGANEAGEGLQMEGLASVVVSLQWRASLHHTAILTAGQQLTTSLGGGGRVPDGECKNVYTSPAEVQRREVTGDGVRMKPMALYFSEMCRKNTVQSAL